MGSSKPILAVVFIFLVLVVVFIQGVKNHQGVKGDDIDVQVYRSKALVSTHGGFASNTDPLLDSPFGAVWGPSGFLYVVSELSGNVNVYDRRGKPASTATIGLAGGSEGSGIVYNSNPGTFLISSGGLTAAAQLIVVTPTGLIMGYNPSVAPGFITIVNNNAPPGSNGNLAGSVYMGAALDEGKNILYVANLKDGKIEMYSSTWAYLGAFTDPSMTINSTIPSYAPYNVAIIDGQLIATFVFQTQLRNEAHQGPGLGVVDKFALDGKFISRLETGEALNAPWGLAKAPKSFGRYGGALLVGNYGDGKILAYSMRGEFLGALNNSATSNLEVSRLRALVFRPRRIRFAATRLATNTVTSSVTVTSTGTATATTTSTHCESDSDSDSDCEEKSRPRRKREACRPRGDERVCGELYFIGSRLRIPTYAHGVVGSIKPCCASLPVCCSKC